MATPQERDAIETIRAESLAYLAQSPLINRTYLVGSVASALNRADSRHLAIARDAILQAAGELQALVETSIMDDADFDRCNANMREFIESSSQQPPTTHVMPLKRTAAILAQYESVGNRN